MITVFCWGTRLLGTLLLVLILTIAIGEGVPNPFHASLRENLLGLALIIMIKGQIVAWKREGIGGILILSGLGLVAVVNHGIPFNEAVGMWLATGLLYLACWRMKHGT